MLTEGLRIRLGPIHATGVALEELFRTFGFKLASDRLLHLGKKKNIWISVFTVSSSTTPLATSRTRVCIE